MSRKPRLENESVQYWLFVDSRTRVVSRRLSQQAAEDFIINLKKEADEAWSGPSFFNQTADPKLENRKSKKVTLNPPEKPSTAVKTKG